MTSRNSGGDPLFYPGVAALIPDHDNREIIQVAEKPAIRTRDCG